jgi:hypothetical protein
MMKKVDLSYFGDREPFSDFKLKELKDKKLEKFIRKNMDNELFLAKIRNGLFIGANPREEDLEIAKERAYLLFNGDKEFSYGLGIER